MKKKLLYGVFVLLGVADIIAADVTCVITEGISRKPIRALCSKCAAKNAEGDCINCTGSWKLVTATDSRYAGASHVTYTHRALLVPTCAFDNKDMPANIRALRAQASDLHSSSSATVALGKTARGVTKTVKEVARGVTETAVATASAAVQTLQNQAEALRRQANEMRDQIVREGKRARKELQDQANRLEQQASEFERQARELRMKEEAAARR